MKSCCTANTQRFLVNSQKSHILPPCPPPCVSPLPASPGLWYTPPTSHGISHLPTRGTRALEMRQEAGPP